MKFIEKYTWGWTYPERYIGACQIYRNGVPFPHGGRYIFTIFGFGVCLYDKVSGNGDFKLSDIWEKNRWSNWSIGKFLVVIDEKDETVPAFENIGGEEEK